MLATRAPAKINLTLAIAGRRADGYHELKSLVAFAGVGDELSLVPGGPDRLTVSGPFGAALAMEADNLVLRAATALRARVPDLIGGSFHLVKRLPLASGIGGGSADAAGALRLLARANGLALTDPRLGEAARVTGADVPVCLEGKARWMSGIGEVLGPALGLPRLFAVLVNAGRPVSTRSVFAQLGLSPGARTAMAPTAIESWLQDQPTDPRTALLALLADHGNDLETPARVLEPVIDSTLSALRATAGLRLARMSGSGATCFGLYDDCRASAAAARTIARANPGWWVKATVLR
jgi:4-diphosphocytidyl-2-C-methyl-D-erythritol kinase